MKEILGKTFGEERALYAIKDARVKDCRFEGVEDGESFLKECENVSVEDCYMDLRYPMWHARSLSIKGGEMTLRCRAALWYDNAVSIEGCKIDGVKALRESKDISIAHCDINSPEFCWRCKNVSVRGGSVEGEYAFFESENVSVDGIKFNGKYSFQYIKGLSVTNSVLKTKDAFWHTQGAVIKDCVIDGEYLGWYSDGLTLIRCRIKGTQPLCYCTNLKLIDCTMEDCDLSFEYSEVDADIKGAVTSVKNPLKGRIVADGYGEIILKDSKYPCEAEIVVR